jgi:hypothetical protein
VTVVSAVDDLLVVNGALTFDLVGAFRTGTRSVLNEGATTRDLRFLDTVPTPDGKAFGRLEADPDAVATPH